MIARIWRGWATAHDAPLYRQHFIATVQPQLAALPGFRGCMLMQSLEGHEMAFIATTYWESLDHLRAFAGEQVDVAVVEPAAQAVLLRYEHAVRHFEIVVAMQPQPPA